MSSRRAQPSLNAKRTAAQKARTRLEVDPTDARQAVVELYQQRREEIRQRLLDFQAVAPSEWFYELCFCLCTPQSKAIHAAQVVEELKRQHFFERGDDPTAILAAPAHYIRFHNVKAKNLLRLRENFSTIESQLRGSHDSYALRASLVEVVRGMGMKEASHFLRNIGIRDLAIIDRHVLKHLHRCGVIDSTNHPSSTKRYEEIERQWKRFASDIRISIDELDLVFWSMETSFILK